MDCVAAIATKTKQTKNSFIRIQQCNEILFVVLIEYLKLCLYCKKNSPLCIAIYIEVTLSIYARSFIFNEVLKNCLTCLYTARIFCYTAVLSQQC